MSGNRLAVIASAYLGVWSLPWQSQHLLRDISDAITLGVAAYFALRCIGTFISEGKKQ
jgi:hypothetical protein